MDPQELSSLVKSTSNNLNTGTIMAYLIFGSIGFVALMYGWKNKSPKPLVIGLALSIYPFFTSNTYILFGVGAALTALLYFWRD